MGWARPARSPSSGTSSSGPAKRWTARASRTTPASSSRMRRSIARGSSSSSATSGSTRLCSPIRNWSRPPRTSPPARSPRSNSRRPKSSAWSSGSRPRSGTSRRLACTIRRRLSTTSHGSTEGRRGGTDAGEGSGCSIWTGGSTCTSASRSRSGTGTSSRWAASTWRNPACATCARNRRSGTSVRSMRGRAHSIDPSTSSSRGILSRRCGRSRPRTRSAGCGPSSRCTGRGSCSMRIAIATSSAGHGPVAAARNLALALASASRGSAEVSVIDLPRQLGAMADLTVNRFYNFSLRHGLLWNRIGVGVSFRLDWARIGRFMSRGPETAIPGLRADAVVFTTPWLVEQALDGLAPDVKTYAVVLDLGPPLSPGWACAGISHVYAPTADARDALGGRGDLLVAPVFPPGTHRGDSRCEKCDGAPSVLLMGGRSGYANLPALLRGLSTRGGLHLTALSGTDPAFRASLERIASHSRSHMVVRPFVAEVSPLLATHDVVLSKPGTMTIGEALAHGKPLLLDGSGGLMPQEIGNARFVDRSAAGSLVRSPAYLSRAMERLIEGPTYARAAGAPTGPAAAGRLAAPVLRET